MSHKISDTEFRESLDRRLSSLQPAPENRGNEWAAAMGIIPPGREKIH